MEGQGNTIFPGIYGLCETYEPTSCVQSKQIDNSSWIYIILYLEGGGRSLFYDCLGMCREWIKVRTSYELLKER
jgi:hypothetical protein